MPFVISWGVPSSLKLLGWILRGLRGSTKAAWRKLSRKREGKQLRRRENSMLSIWEMNSVCRTSLSKTADFWRPWLFIKYFERSIVAYCLVIHLKYQRQLFISEVTCMSLTARPTKRFIRMMLTKTVNTSIIRCPVNVKRASPLSYIIFSYPISVVIITIVLMMDDGNGALNVL